MIAGMFPAISRKNKMAYVLVKEKNMLTEDLKPFADEYYQVDIHYSDDGWARKDIFSTLVNGRQKVCEIKEYIWK